MTRFVAGGDPGARNRFGNRGTAGGRFMVALRLAASAASAPLRAYLRSRSRRRALENFGAVDMHTLEDIGLLRTHLAALSVSEDNDNNPHAVVPPALIAACRVSGGAAPVCASL